MSLSWSFLTKPFVLLRYRDMIAGIVIGKFVANKWITYNSDKSDYDWAMTKVYIHDESDIAFRESTNMVDSAVKRDKSIAFAKMVKEERAKKERELMLDAYNYLNGKSHACDP